MLEGKHNFQDLNITSISFPVKSLVEKETKKIRKPFLFFRVIELRTNLKRKIFFGTIFENNFFPLIYAEEKRFHFANE